MELWFGLDAEQFSARAGGFLTANIERNVLATVLIGAVEKRYSGAVFAVVCNQHGDTVAAALRTPPHNMLVTGTISDPDAFLATWMGLDPRPPGVSGEPVLARSIANAWVRTTQGRVETHLKQALHMLERVIPPDRLVPGTLRRADFRQSAQMGEWGLAFATDANLPNPSQSAAGVEHQLAQQRLYVWELDGTPVALVGHNVEINGTVRIGPVYTPPQLRGQGYATAATAALSQRLLDAGAERCILYTDLANPISNHIYAQIGYVQVGDWEELAFDLATG